MIRSIARLALVALAFSGGAAQAAPFYTASAKRQIKAQLGLPRSAKITFSTTRTYHPPAMQRTRLYELRDGSYTATTDAGVISGAVQLRVMRSGRVKVSLPAAP